MIVQEQQLFTEIFPVDVDSLPPLFAYQVGVSRGDVDALGSALAGEFEMLFGGHWVWVRQRLMTDNPPNPVKLLMAVETLTKQDARQFPRSTTVEHDYQWQPSAQDVADFVISGPLADLDPLFRDALAKTTYRLSNARVERDYHVYGWAVDGYPSVSFSVDSRLIYDPDLATYAEVVKDLDAVIGLRVSDKLSPLQGEVTAIVGTLAEQRQRLTAITHNPEMRELLAAAPDTDPVVRVQAGRYEYDYPATALNVVISMDDARRFDVTSQEAAKALGVKPALRAQLVKVVADIAKAERVVTNAYSTPIAPEVFDFAPVDFKIALGSGPTRFYEPISLPSDVMSAGPYWLRERFAKEPLRLAVINACSGPAEDFLVAMGRAMQKTLGIAVEVVRERKVRVVTPPNLESAVRLLQKEPFDVIVAFVDTPRDEPDGSDHFVRMQTIGRGLSCLIIDESVLNDPDSMPAVMLGLLARAGSAPFLFDLPLNYADYVVGLDLIQAGKRGGDNVTGVVRVYRNDGGLLWYMIASAPVEEEGGVPQSLLAQLFPADSFAGKHVIMHHNGRLSEAAWRSLDSWSAQLDAAFYPVELSREGTPRLYALANGRIACPLRGSLFRLGPNEAFLVSASHEHEDFQPLYVRSQALPLDQAVQSVMQFAALSYGIVPAAMPATLLNADLVGVSLIRGVMPDNVSGDVPFWL